MASRATWKGLLQIAQVRIPIKVFPATESSESLSFNQLHDCTTNTRVTQKKWCTTCAREVPSAEIVKGFEFEKGRYVLLLEAELDAVQPPSTRVIELTRFAKASALDPVFIHRSYYLAPDGPTAGDAYAVLGQAMRGTVGIGKLAIYGREYLVAVRPQPIARPYVTPLLLHTLHHAAEIRACDMLDDVPIDTPVRSAATRLAGQVIAALRGPLQLADFVDQYQVDLQRLIAAKVAGQEIVEAAVPEAVPVLTLLDALTQSLQAVKRTRAS